MSSMLGILLFVTFVSDPVVNSCGERCFERMTVPNEFSISPRLLVFRKELIGSEIYASYTIWDAFGPAKPVIGASVSEFGDFWIGAGVKYTRYFGAGKQFFFEFSAMPGLYYPGSGPVLGHRITYRSEMAIGYEFDNGTSLKLAGGHRSNAGLSDFNPGVETLGLTYTIPLK